MTGVLLGILLMTCTAGSLARNLCPTHKMDAVIHKLGTKTNETKKLLKCVVWQTGAKKIVDAIPCEIIICVFKTKEICTQKVNLCS